MFPRSHRTLAPSRVSLVRTLESLECRVTPAGLTHTTTTSTLVTEVVTNTPTTIELADTRVVVAHGNALVPVFSRLIPVAYDPANPDIVAAIADARAVIAPVESDVTGDGVPEITVGQLGGGSKVRIFDLTGKLLSEFTAYEPTFAGGVFLSIGDADGNGSSEVILGAGPGGGPRVRAFVVAADGALTEVQNGFSFDPNTRDGVKDGTSTNATGQAMVVAGLRGRTRLMVASLNGIDDDAPFGPTWTGGLWVS